MTRYEAHIEKDWREQGRAQVFVLRQRDDDSTDLGFFVVDPWCLGVKDAWGEQDLTPDSAEKIIAEQLPEEHRERIHPACAKKLIEGAAAYAESLGFSPHRDYRKARKVLSSLDASLCPTDFTFGRDGRPCFVADPDDTEERIARVVAVLTARCGQDGFDLEVLEDDDPSALREALMEWLHDEPNDVPRFYQVSGMITAMQICPQPLSPTLILQVLWGPEGRQWESQADVQDFTEMLMDYWNYVAGLLEAALRPEAVQADQAMDIWVGEFGEDPALGVMAATFEWATGFMRAVSLWPEAWGDARQRPDLARHWEVVDWWADLIGTGNKDRIAAAAEESPPRNIGQSVIYLAQALRTPPPARE